MDRCTPSITALVLTGEGMPYRRLKGHFGSPVWRGEPSQALYMDRSAIGYTAVPYVVGGTGWVFTADVGTWF